MSSRIPVPVVPAFVELASDCYCTPPGQGRLIHRLWPRGIVFDPFGDHASAITAAAQYSLDVRRGEDAYRQPWAELLDKGDTIMANGPYSGDHPAKTAEACALAAIDGLEVLNLTPAAVGSVYWREFVWPRAKAIAWLGRLAFQAGRDMYSEPKGDEPAKLLAKAGTIVKGNRYELAMVYDGPHAQAFRALWRGAGFVVTTPD